MKTLPSICLLFLALCCLTEEAQSQTLLVDSCSISADLQEMHQHHSNIRLNAITEDEEIGVKLLSKRLMEDVQDGQRCCFLRLVLQFYIDKVFPSYLSSHPQNQSSSSSLANTFIIIVRKQMIQKCHCLCEQETQKKVDSLLDAFNKLEASKAVLKAVGELDTVLQWLQLFDQSLS
uniref:Interleukin family protein n=1 Tax=Tetraodon nigroviridis TaxID=99883 RepID=Q7SX60_TETNG|nr:interleukin-20 [Tetraodon nigroviridis]AAP57416.1 interleukin-20 [Tetraodon nigroviridis]